VPRYCPRLPALVQRQLNEPAQRIGRFACEPAGRARDLFEGGLLIQKVVHIELNPGVLERTLVVREQVTRRQIDRHVWTHPLDRGGLDACGIGRVVVGRITVVVVTGVVHRELRGALTFLPGSRRTCVPGNDGLGAGVVLIILQPAGEVVDERRPSPQLRGKLDEVLAAEVQDQVAGGRLVYVVEIEIPPVDVGCSQRGTCCARH